MTVDTTPHDEERAARDRMRAIRRARAAKAKADAGRRGAVIHEDLGRPRAKECRCPITPSSTLEDLLALAPGAPPVGGSVRRSTRSVGGSGDERDEN